MTLRPDSGVAATDWQHTLVRIFMHARVLDDSQVHHKVVTETAVYCAVTMRDHMPGYFDIPYSSRLRQQTQWPL